MAKPTAYEHEASVRTKLVIGFCSKLRGKLISSQAECAAFFGFRFNWEGRSESRNCGNSPRVLKMPNEAIDISPKTWGKYLK